MKQMTNWCVCQVCGRTIAASEACADGWLVGPWRSGVRYVRCYEHWSEWALRRSGLGRTKNLRNKAQLGRIRAAETGVTMKPIYEPFPMEDRA